VGFQEVRRRIVKGGDKLVPEFAGLSEESPEGQEVSDRRREIFKTKYLPGLRGFPRARELLQRMRDDGLRLVVASSAKSDEVQALLRIAGVEDLVEATTSSDDAESSKPDPDIVCAALQHAKAPAAHVLMLGDTPYDVEAALRAGVGIVALRCGGWDDDALRGALEIYDDPADLLAHYERSAFGRRRAPAATAR
jgi:phosphoglycolate phosphatase-like HAD superfamily hydrolase